MSFFIHEEFALPDGSFQNGIDTETSGNGTIFQDETYGYIQTYADADGAIIVSADSLSVSEFFNTPIKISITYELTSITDNGDYIRLITLLPKSAQPTIASIGNAKLYINLYRSADHYYERWLFYDIDDNQFSWNEGGGAWAAGAAQDVREISLNTEYTIEIIWHPETQTATFTNDDGDTAETDERIYRDGEDWWWYLGDNSDTDRYGQFKLSSLVIQDISVAAELTTKNALTTERWFSNQWDATFLQAVNSLQSEVYCDLTAQNSILDYDPVYCDINAFNRIGKPTFEEKSYTVQILHKDIDITKGVVDWDITYNDSKFCKSIAIALADKSLVSDPLTIEDDDYSIPTLEVIVDGETEGEFYLEENTQNITVGKYRADYVGRSKTAVLDSPYSTRLTTSWEDTTKLAIVQSLLDDLPIALDLSWNILDAKIPYYSANNQVPYDIIKELVTSGGGRIWTDNEDTLIIDYKYYSTVNKSSILSASIPVSEIPRVRRSLQSALGYNSVEVYGFDDSLATGAWPVIQLYPSKSELKSDGADFLTLTAYCWNENGDYNDVEEIIDEESTPSQPNVISVSEKAAIKRVIGIWVDDGGSHGDLIDGPYTFDGSTITTTGDMDQVQHLVSYVGGDTCSFSCDSLGSIEESSVLIEDGVAQTKLRATAGGGGEIRVEASFKGQIAEAIIMLDDPQVGYLDAFADPSSLGVEETSTIYARVRKPDGFAAVDGYTVYFSIASGGVGQLSSSSATTSTDEITDEECISSNEVNIGVEFPIDSITSIYPVYDLDDDNNIIWRSSTRGRTIPSSNIDKTINYADYVDSFSGNSIVLSKALPYKKCVCVVTYDSGGIAQVTYTAPSSITEGQVVTIRVRAGGEDEIVTINLNTQSTGAGKDIPALGDGPWQYTTFEFDETPKAGGDGICEQTKAIGKISDDYDLQIDEGGTEFPVPLVGGKLGDINTSTDILTDTNYITVSVQADTILHTVDVGPQKKISGSRLVYDDKTKKPVEGASVTIYWTESGGDENETDLETNSKGRFFFNKGVSGATRIEITHDDYEDFSSTINIEDPLAGAIVGSSYDYYDHVLGEVAVRWRYKRLKGIAVQGVGVSPI